MQWQLDAAFGVAPGTVVPGGSWVDISGDVEGWTVDTGRRDEFASFDAGTLTATLDNHLGRYDPEHASGPYVGNLKPLTPIRLRAGTSTPDQDMFYGYVDINGWRVTPRHPEDSTGHITCVDLFEVLANLRAPSSALYVEAESEAPTHWWRMADPVDEAWATDIGSTPSINGYYAFASKELGSDSPVFGESSGALGVILDPSPAVWPYAHTFGVTDANISGDFGAAFTIEWNGDVTSSQTVTPLYAVDTASTELTQQWWVTFGTNTTNRLVSLLAVDPASTTTMTTINVAPTGSVFIYVRRIGTTWQLGTVDEVSAQTASFTLPAFATSDLQVRTNSTSTTERMVVADLLVWEGTVPSAARMAEIGDAAITGWEGDLAGERLTRLAEIAGLDAALTSFDVGQSTLQGATFDGSILDAMQATADADRGRLYVDHHDGGVLRFIDRTAIARSGVNLLTADQAGAEGSITGWSAVQNCTVARSTAQAYEGAASLRLEASAAGGMSAATPTGTSGIPIDPTRLINITVRSRADSVGRQFAYAVTLYRATGSICTPDSFAPSTGIRSHPGGSSSSGNNTTTGWTTGTLTFDPSAHPDARFLALRVGIEAAGGVGERHYFDGMSVTQGRSVEGSVWTLGDDGSTEVPYSRIRLQDDKIINTATVTRKGGKPHTATDAASVTAYLPRSYSESDLIFLDDTEAVTRAEFLVDVYGTRTRRCREVVLEPRKSTHPAWPVVVDVRIADWLTVNYRPSYGALQTYEVVVEGIGHEWSQAAQAWRTVLALSPLSAVEPY